jgi:RHS repeat-associated protein
MSCRITSNSYHAQFDAENRQKQVVGTVGGTTTTTNYSYDGDGKRVKKSVTTGSTTTTTRYVYDASGQLTAEYSTAPNPDSGTQYLSQDHLGSTRLAMSVSLVNSQPTLGNINRSDYLPFGQEIPSTWNGRSNYQPDPSETVKFTSKERDSETGLDYFGARYFSAAQGRFTSPDEFPGGIVDPFTGQQVEQPGPLPYADITDPQTLNKYAYVRNNPLRYTDPDGHADTGVIGQVIDEIESDWAELQKGYQVFVATSGLSAGTAAGSSRWGLLAGPALFIGAMIHPATVSTGDLTPEQIKQQQQQQRQPGQVTPVVPSPQDAHKNKGRPSTEEKHQEGEARKSRDRGGEKGDARRRPPRKRPDDWKGPWPPKPPKPPDPPKKKLGSDEGN